VVRLRKVDTTIGTGAVLVDHKEDHKVDLAGQEVQVAPVATCMDEEVLMESDLVVLLVDQ
jgi:hypothetical protein